MGQTTLDKAKTYGHSLLVHPWGNVLSDLGQEVMSKVFDFDLSDSDIVRQQIPSLANDREYESLV